MDSLITEHLTLRVDTVATPDGEILRVAWLGRADDRQPASTLGPFLGELLAEAAGAGATVAHRFESLEHFNSATIAVLMQFVRAAGERLVPVSLVYDARKKWQKLTFDVLQRFEDPAGLLRVRGVAGGDGRHDVPA